jgi:hypothetical protein
MGMAGTVLNLPDILSNKTKKGKMSWITGASLTA